MLNMEFPPIALERELYNLCVCTCLANTGEISVCRIRPPHQRSVNALDLPSFFLVLFALVIAFSLPVLRSAGGRAGVS